jgi:hypothetical protein
MLSERREAEYAKQMLSEFGMKHDKSQESSYATYERAKTKKAIFGDFSLPHVAEVSYPVKALRHRAP